MVEKRPVMSHWPGLQVFPCNGEGSGKHLYLKSTLSTLVLSEHSLEQCVCVGGGTGDGSVCEKIVTKKTKLRKELAFCHI